MAEASARPPPPPLIAQGLAELVTLATQMRALAVDDFSWEPLQSLSLLEPLQTTSAAFFSSQSRKHTNVAQLGVVFN